MITSTINYTKKKKKKTDRQNPRTNVKSKAIRTKITQRSIHVHTDKKRKRENIYISIYFFKRRKRATKSTNKSTNDNKL